MLHEDRFERIAFADLRTGDVLVDISNLAAVVDTSRPVPIGDGLAMLAVLTYTPDGDPIGDAEHLIAIVDELDSVRLVALRGRPCWRPPPVIATVEHLLALSKDLP